MSHALLSFSPSIWTVFHPLRIGGMNLGSRCTIIKLPSGGLVLISPTRFDDATANAVDSIGPVDTIIAPNLFHHLFFNDASQRWPTARALVPEGLPQRVPIVERAVTMAPHGCIEDTVFWHRIEGAPRVSEHAFIVPNDNTLILTDTAFHFRDHPQRWLRFMMRLLGAYQRFGPSRLFRSTIKDPRAFGQSLATLLDYSWDSIIVAHGEPLPTQARQTFLHAFSSYLDLTTQ